MSIRISKKDWYFQIARDVALRSPCISRRRFGAILVKNDNIIATGYNGSVRGAINCGVDNLCLQNLKNVMHNKDYSSCCAVHSEQNVLLNSARNGISTLNSTLYLAEANGKDDRPCFLCRRFLIQAGVKDCYYKKDNKIIYEEVESWIKLENEWIKNEINNCNTK